MPPVSQVSAIGFGCQEVGGGYGDIDEAEFARAVGRALDLGINLLRHRRGLRLRRVGGGARAGVGRRRDEAIIVHQVRDRVPGPPELPRRAGASGCARRSTPACSASAPTTSTSTLVHWPDRATPFEETLGALDDLVHAGKVRFVGVSNFTAEELAACMRVRRVDVVQYVHGLFDRRMEREILPYCAEHDLAFVGYGSLAYGLLSGTLAAGHRVPGRRLALQDRQVGRDVTPVRAPLRSRRDPRERRGGRRPAAVGGPPRSRRSRSSRCAGRPRPTAVSASLVGCRSVAEVDDDVGALGWSLDADDRAEIDAIFDRHGVDPCPDYWIETMRSG